MVENDLMKWNRGILKKIKAFGTESQIVFCLLTFNSRTDIIFNRFTFNRFHDLIGYISKIRE